MSLEHLLNTPHDEIPEVIGELHKTIVQLQARYIEAVNRTHDRLVDVKEAAELSGMSVSWIRHNAKRAGFAQPMGLRAVRYSVKRIEEWKQRERRKEYKLKRIAS